MANSSNTLSNDETRKIVATVLGVENSAAWHIVSQEGDLAMVHHRPEANLLEWGAIRGIVIDTATKTVVCRSYGYTSTVTCDRLRVNPEGFITLSDENKVEYQLDPAATTFNRGYEGPLLAVFKHGGVVYRSTRKRLDPSRSRWGASKPFIQMYEEMGGPSDEDLFDPTKDYSPFVHLFILVHPDVVVATKENLDGGYIAYIGTSRMWEDEACPYPLESTETEPVSLPVKPDANLTLEEANRHLKFGTYSEFEGWENLDERMLPGEFIIAQCGGVTLRVESIPYAWRLRMRDNNPNLFHRFFQLVTDSYIRCDETSGRDKFNSLYPIFTPYDQHSVKDQVDETPYIAWPQDPEFRDPELLNTKEDRMYNIWLAFLNAVPLHRQKEVCGFLSKLYAYRGELITFLRTVERKNNYDGFSPRLQNICEQARKYAKVKKGRGQDQGRNGRTLTMNQLTSDNIRNLVNKEKGGSLYRLVREMHRYKEEQAAGNQ